MKHIKPILSLSDISYTYPNIAGSNSLSDSPAVLDKLSLDFAPGSFTCIVGPSGCGKSTLLSIIAGLIVPDSGSIHFNNDSDSSSCHIGYMLQQDCLFEWRSVYRNVTLGLELARKCSDASLKRIDNYLCNYGLSDFKHLPPSTLSGGMRQRAALIRTLALEPDILLLDEPFCALDYQTRLEVSEDIYYIIRQQHKTAILVTHDISEAICLGQRVVVLSKRPCRVKDIFDINFKDDIAPTHRRSHSDFSVYFNLIWEALR